MTVQTEYVVRELQTADETAVLQLLTASLAGGPTGERTAAFLRWKHGENPSGASPGLVAIAEDGSVAAVRLLMRWDLRLGDVPVRAVRAVDTATHPDHQGRGLFKRLTLQALDGVAADADLVFNTPNDQSRPGYLKMGWREVGQVPIYLRPVRPLRLLRGLRTTGQQAVTGPESPVPTSLAPAAAVLRDRRDEVADLLDVATSAAHPLRLRTDGSMDQLLWRFGPPGLDYRAVVVEQSGRLRGLGLGRLRRRGPLAELTLGQVLVRPGDTDAARHVLRTATRSGADHVTGHWGRHSELAAVGARTGYLRIPGRGLTLTVNPRRPLPVDVTDLDSWDLQLADLELF